MADNEWVGKKFRARCLMHLPDQGEKRPGEEFTFTAACAKLGLDPESWLTVGNAELVGKATAKHGPSPGAKPDDKPKPRPDDEPKPAAADATSKAPPVAVLGKPKGGDD